MENETTHASSRDSLAHCWDNSASCDKHFEHFSVKSHFTKYHSVLKDHKHTLLIFTMFNELTYPV